MGWSVRVSFSYQIENIPRKRWIYLTYKAIPIRVFSVLLNSDLSCRGSILRNFMAYLFWVWLINPPKTVTSHENRGAWNLPQQLDCLQNFLFGLATKKTLNLHITGLLWRECDYSQKASKSGKRYYGRHLCSWWASCQIRKIVGCACAGNVFPAPAG